MNLDLEVDVLLERGVDLVGGELREALLEEVYLELDVEVLLLERVDVLQEHVSGMINTNPSFHVAAATDIAWRTPLT